MLQAHNVPLSLHIQKNCYYFRNNSSLRVCAMFLEYLNIKRNHVFFRRLMGIHTTRFISIQAMDLPTDVVSINPPHCLVVKMMKQKFFNSQRIRKSCCSNGVVGLDINEVGEHIKILFTYEPHILCKKKKHDL